MLCYSKWWLLHKTSKNFFTVFKADTNNVKTFILCIPACYWCACFSVIASSQRPVLIWRGQQSLLHLQRRLQCAGGQKPSLRGNCWAAAFIARWASNSAMYVHVACAHYVNICVCVPRWIQQLRSRGMRGCQSSKCHGKLKEISRQLSISWASLSTVDRCLPSSAAQVTHQGFEYCPDKQVFFHQPFAKTCPVKTVIYWHVCIKNRKKICYF